VILESLGEPFVGLSAAKPASLSLFRAIGEAQQRHKALQISNGMARRACAIVPILEAK
jgi:hypothetical protein